MPRMTLLAPPAVGRRSIDFGATGANKFGGAERRSEVVRRAGARARSLLTGKVIVGDGEMSVDCVVRNLSARGARVSVPRAIDLPRQVGLLVVREGLFCEAAVAWRNGEQTGLTFRARHDLATDTDKSRRGIRALWSAIAP
jgi:hypothetical protein